MHVNQDQNKIRSFGFDSIIWGLYPQDEDNKFIVELRDEKDKTVMLKLLHTQTTTLNNFDYRPEWWEKILFFEEGLLYSLKYPEQNNPATYSVYVFDDQRGISKEIDQLPQSATSMMIYPEVYEHGTSYHKTVNEFLSFEQPLGCEYLEIKDYIIISYYLRSENGFDRQLLCLKNGEKVWKVQQDVEMKGMAIGAFFVLNEQLIFIKDRNEVCFYDM